MGWNLDWLLGARDWCVIDDGGSPKDYAVYAIPKGRVTSGDTVTIEGLRRGEAIDMARTIRRGHALNRILAAPHRKEPHHDQ